MNNDHPVRPVRMIICVERGSVVLGRILEQVSFVYFSYYLVGNSSQKKISLLLARSFDDRERETIYSRIQVFVRLVTVDCLLCDLMEIGKWSVHNQYIAF